MPIPFIIGAAAIIAGTAGVGLGVHGGVKLKKANDTLQRARERHESNKARLDRMHKSTSKDMDTLGKNELQIMHEFELFHDLYSRIKNCNIVKIKLDDKSIEKLTLNDIKQASIGAAILIGGLEGAALGTAGGFAASGATTAAVMALGSASTGTAISTLSGVAATNATLAAIGGGSLAAGGGGIALGTTLLGAATLGAGLLVGGAIFSLTGSKLSDKADQAWSEMISNEEKINNVCLFLSDLHDAVCKYNDVLLRMRELYFNQMYKMRKIINEYIMITGNGYVDWLRLSSEEQLVIKNAMQIVGLLYNMCQVKILLKSESSDQKQKINKPDMNKALKSAEDFMDGNA